MIDLDSSVWMELTHAYGSAEDVPALLKALEPQPDAHEVEAEPYQALWSSLCHQGDAYYASYAASPHLLEEIFKVLPAIAYLRTF